MPPMSLLDWQQIVKLVYDETNNRLRTDATLSGSIGEISIDHTNDSIRLGDGTTLFTGSTISSKTGLDVNVLNQLEVAQSGLKIAVKSSRIAVGTTPVAVPSSSLANRNGLSIRVLGPSTVYIGSSAVTATVGYPKFSGEEVIIDATDDITLYAVCAAGESSELAILEIA